jgi:hypothetical protein
VELAPAFEPPRPCDSASKLDALHTLRVAVHPQKPSQLANNFDYCSAEAGAGHLAELFNKTGRRPGSRFDCLIAATAMLAQAEIATVNL